MIELTKYEVELQNHLRKCELLFAVKNAPFGTIEIKWLEPYCNSVQSIADFLRSLGFRIQNIVDEETCWGEKHQWVETTSGIIVYVNDESTHGLIAPATLV